MSGKARAPYTVLFLCTGNAARSIMAEAILNRVGAPSFKAYSAGSRPKGAVNPHAIAFLKNHNFPTDELRSKSWDEFAAPDAPKLDFIFTVCDNAAKDVCPVWPGRPVTAHWGVPDPAAATGSEAAIAQAFTATYRMLQNRIAIFCALPLANLDRLSQQRMLADIGRE